MPSKTAKTTTSDPTQANPVDTLLQNITAEQAAELRRRIMADQPAEEVASTFAAQGEAMMQAAESLLARVVESEHAPASDQRNQRTALSAIRRVLTAGEIQVFRSLGWDDHRVYKEFARLCDVHHHLAVVGSPGEYAEALDRASKASADRDAAEETLPQVIAEAEAKLAAARREDEQAQRDLQRRRESAKILRKKAPAHIRDRAENLRSVAGDAWRRLTEARDALKLAEQVIANDFEKRPHPRAEAIGGLCRRLGIPYDESAYREARLDCRERIQSLRDEVEQAEHRHQLADEKLRQAFDFYTAEHSIDIED